MYGYTWLVISSIKTHNVSSCIYLLEGYRQRPVNEVNAVRTESLAVKPDLHQPLASCWGQEQNSKRSNHQQHLVRVQILIKARPLANLILSCDFHLVTPHLRPLCAALRTAT